jgi:transposase
VRLSGGCHLARGGSQCPQVAPKAAAAAVEQIAPNVAFVSYDEKPGIQAIANTAPDLPPVAAKRACVARDHEYKRHGTLSLLAGIDLLTLQVHACVEYRHRLREFIGFLKRLNAAYSADTAIKLILDNHSAHVSKETKQWLATQREGRFSFVFTPKHGSWLTWSRACSRRWCARSCVTFGWLRKPNSSNGSWRTSTPSIASLLSTRGPTKSRCQRDRSRSMETLY